VGPPNHQTPNQTQNDFQAEDFIAKVASYSNPHSTKLQSGGEEEIRLISTSTNSNSPVSTTGGSKDHTLSRNYAGTQDSNPESSLTTNEELTAGTPAPHSQNSKQSKWNYAKDCDTTLSLQPIQNYADGYSPVGQPTGSQINRDNSPSTQQGRISHTSTTTVENSSSQPGVPIISAATTDMPSVPSNPYIPGKLHGKPLHFLIDTGCTNSILSKTMFDRLPATVRSTLRPSQTGATMADGSRTKIYGQISLKAKLRTLRKDIDFQVARTHHDAILGMDFLNNGCCLVDLGKSTLEVDGKQLACTDKFGNLLSSKVQVLRSTQIPPGSELSVACRLTNTVPGHQGLVEGKLQSDLAVAACLVSPTDGNHILPVRCYNPASHAITLTAGRVIGSYTPVTDEQITVIQEELCLNHLDMTNNSQSLSGSNLKQEELNPQIYSVPDHLKNLYLDASRNCSTSEECQGMAKLLNSYSDVFSSGPNDVGLTNLVTHSIPLLPGTKPIKQPPRRLGAHRDQEVERQVKELLDQGRIEPHNGAWSSPVVLVTKKDGGWRMCVDYRK
jgi:hypothetical protein